MSKAKEKKAPTILVVEASPGLPEQIKRELESLDALKASLARCLECGLVDCDGSTHARRTGALPPKRGKS